MGKKRILVIDDDAHVRKAVRCVMERHNHDVTEASNGEEGLALCGQDRFDLVITDLHMGKLDGATLADNLRRSIPGQKIIMMTAHPEAAKHADHCVNAIIEKPFTIEHLLENLRAVL